jgi:transposase
VAEVIQRSFGIRYHPNHIWRVLQGLGWSCQKPERRARERDEETIERWKKRRWPAIKKTLALGAHLAFLDESGFMLIPLLWRTWAPRGQTPIVRHVYRRERLSVISALTVSPQRRHWGVYFSLQVRNIKGGDVASFLRFLLGHLRGQVVLVWDEALIHKDRPVRDFLTKHPGLHVERFPKYAPELNPAEHVWTQSKRRLANSSAQGISELQSMVGSELGRIQYSQHLLKSCLLATELSWP